MDYLVLGLDSKWWLTCLVWPTAETGEGRLDFGDLGYRNALCELIGGHVTAVGLARGSEVRLAFSGSAELRFDLTQDLPGGEAIIVNAVNEFWTIGADCSSPPTERVHGAACWNPCHLPASIRR